MNNVCLAATILFAAGTLLGGCSLDRPYPAKNTFVLRAGDVPRARATVPKSVRVEQVRIAPPFDGRSLVYRTGDVAFNRDYYNVFIADPENLATGELIRLLSESKAFERVAGSGSMGNSDVSLECMVTDLYADERTPTAGVAICRARFRLLQDVPGSTYVVGDWTFEAKAPVAADSGAAVAEALGVAFGKCVQNFIDAATSSPGANTAPTASN